MQNIMKNRYSCRKFDTTKISDEKVRQIVDLTRLSPSSCGLEPWKFMVISKASDIENLGEICNNQSQVSSCSHAVIIIARNDLKVGSEYLDSCVKRRANTPEKYEAAMKYFEQKFDGMSDEQMTNYASKQCYIAVGNLVNIAQSMGVKSCIIAGFDNAKLTKFIRDFGGLDSRFTPILVVALGNGEEIKFPHTRHDLDDVLIWK